MFPPKFFPYSINFGVYKKENVKLNCVIAFCAVFTKKHNLAILRVLFFSILIEEAIYKSHAQMSSGLLQAHKESNLADFINIANRNH